MAGERTPHQLTWTDFDRAVTELADRVRADGVPDIVVGILRGGMLPAIALTHALGIRTVRAIEVTHTTTDAVDAVKYEKPQVQNRLSLGDVTGLDVVVVDDVVGTGETLATAAALTAVAGARRVRTSTWIVNLANWQLPASPGQALTYIGTTVEGWVKFPWEKQ